MWLAYSYTENTAWEEHGSTLTNEKPETEKQENQTRVEKMTEKTRIKTWPSPALLRIMLFISYACR